MCNRYFPREWLALLSLCVTCVFATVSRADDTGPGAVPPAKALVIAADRERAPYSFIDSNGELVGLAVDLWRLWAQRTGQSISFLTGGRNETLEMMRDGRADLHMGLFSSGERAQFLDFGAPLDWAEVSVFRHRNIRRLNDPAELIAYRVGVIDGRYPQHFLEREYPGVQLVTYARHDALLAAVAAHEIQVLVARTSSVLYHLRSRGESGALAFDAEDPLFRRPILTGIRKGDTALAKLVKDGFARISDDERETIAQRWLNRDDTNAGPGLRLVIALDEQLAPFSFRDRHGEPAGLLVDAWNLWSQAAKQPIEIRLYSPTGAVRAVEFGDADVHGGLYRAPGRDDIMTRTRPLYEVGWRLYGAVGRDPRFEQEPERVGVLSATDTEDNVQQAAPGAVAVQFAVRDHMLRALDERKVDALLHLEFVGTEALKDAGLEERFGAIGESLGVAQLRAAVRTDRAALRERIDAGWSSIPLQAMAEVEARWIIDRAARVYGSDGDAVPTVASEREWLSGNRVVRVAIAPAWQPIEFRSATGEHSGMTRDYLRLVGERLGIEFELKPFATWGDGLRAVEGREADLLSAVVATPEREGVLNFTKPYFESRVVVFGNSDDDYVGTLGRLKGKVIAIERGATYRRVVSESPELQLLPVDSAADGLRAVAGGKADGFMGDAYVAAHSMATEALGRFRAVADTPYVTELSMAVRSDWPILRDLLQRAIDTIDVSAREAIVQKWTGQQPKELPDYTLVWRTAGALSVLLLLTLWWVWLTRRQRDQLELRVRQRTEELESVTVAAQQAAEAKAEFLANMSHEIRTPMNAIIGLNTLARRTQLTEQQDDYLGKIGGAAQNLLGIINDVLDFSKVEAGKLDIESVAFDLDAVLSNVTTIVGGKAEEKGLGLSFNIEADTPRALLGDPLRLGQVLINLANNAIKFTDNGGVTVRARTHEDTDSGLALYFCVEDTGIGLTPAQCGRLFQAFSQADASTTREHGGTGLGLTISKRLVELMGGEIGVESTAGVGSTFWFTLQVGRASPADIATTTSADSTTPEVALQGAHILLVEDNKINQQVARELLKQAGMLVTIANDGREALAELAKQSFSAVLMDVQMPVMDGYTATREIRKNPRYGNLPIIAMTANAMASDRQAAIEAGMDDHVAKPIEVANLMSVLGKWLAKEGGRAGS